MLTIAYSGRSKPSALKLAEAGDDVSLVRRSGPRVDINWGRNIANAELNPDISNCANKRVMRQLFKEHGVPMPRLYSEQEVRDRVNGYTVDSTYMYIGRPDCHTKGRGFWKIRSRFDLDKALRGTCRKKAATHFMEFIDFDREYRVHVFKGKTIRISRKEGLGNGTWLARKPGPVKLRKVRDAARLAVEALGLDFGAVDVLARGDNNDEVFVTEVNAAPGLGGSMPRCYLDAFTTYKKGDWN